MFQFQTGSIKRITGFECALRVIKFQFQTGSIKRQIAGHLNTEYTDKFQFQTGSIKRNGEETHKEIQTRFNSKLVRLKVTFR